MAGNQRTLLYFLKVEITQIIYCIVLFYKTAGPNNVKWIFLIIEDQFFFLKSALKYGTCNVNQNKRERRYVITS